MQTLIGFITARDLETWFYQDRAAHLASCQLPLVVALAGKNNLISRKLVFFPCCTNVL